MVGYEVDFLGKTATAAYLIHMHIPAMVCALMKQEQALTQSNLGVWTLLHQLMCGHTHLLAGGWGVPTHEWCSKCSYSKASAAAHVHTCTHVYVHACTHTHACTCLQVHMHVHVCMHVHVHVRCMCTHVLLY